MIETDRLQLIPLTGSQLRDWLDNLSGLEQSLNCHYDATPLDDIFRPIVESQTTIVQNDPEHFEWHSFWLMIRKEDRVVVGSADFKNVPDEKGQVEIGYGLGEKYEKHGYMTETVEALCDWALFHPEVTSVIAETYRDSTASQNILRRCGFVSDHEEENSLWWRRDK